MSDEQRDELIERAMRGVRGLETHTPHGYDPASDDMTVEFAIKLSEQDAEIAHLRAELAAARSVLIRVDEWWTSLPYGLRQDIEGSGAVPCCIAAVLTALQSHRRTEGK